jgi:glucose-specific phosphotransferase system IIA component
MGIIDRVFKKNDKTFSLGAPVQGKCVPLQEVPDPTFGEGMMGKGIAIIPDGEYIVAPCDGVVEMVFRTGHAITMTTSVGADVLIHVGLDTVKLDGKYFTTLVGNGDAVKAGDRLIKFDREKITEEGYNMITPMVICNSDQFSNFETLTGHDVKAEDPVINLKK